MNVAEHFWIKWFLERTNAWVLTLSDSAGEFLYSCSLGWVRGDVRCSKIWPAVGNGTTWCLRLQGKHVSTTYKIRLHAYFHQWCTADVQHGKKQNYASHPHTISITSAVCTWSHGQCDHLYTAEVVKIVWGWEARFFKSTIAIGFKSIHYALHHISLYFGAELFTSPCGHGKQSH